MLSKETMSRFARCKHPDPFRFLYRELEIYDPGCTAP